MVWGPTGSCGPQRRNFDLKSAWGIKLEARKAPTIEIRDAIFFRDHKLGNPQLDPLLR